MARLRRAVVLLLVVVGEARVAPAQGTVSRFEVSGQVMSVASAEFDASDVGASGRVGWQATRILGLEAEVAFYPGDFPDRPAISRGRVEWLFGVTAGPRVGRLRPFARLRPGFLRVQPAPEPIACILIFPPPLACTMAAGRTLVALDVGGGVEAPAGRRTFVRADIGDRIVRYPGPVFTRDRRVRTDGFFSHDLRVSVGGGLRF